MPLTYPLCLPSPSPMLALPAPPEPVIPATVTLTGDEPVTLTGSPPVTMTAMEPLTGWPVAYIHAPVGLADLPDLPEPLDGWPTGYIVAPIGLDDLADLPESVEVLVRDVLRLHQTVEQLDREQTIPAWEAGRKLIVIRDDRIKTKTWEASFKSGWKWDDGTRQPDGDLCAVSLSTAKRYIRLARYYPDRDSLKDRHGVVPLSEAYERAGIRIHGRTAAEKAIETLDALAMKLVKVGEQFEKLAREGFAALATANNARESVDDQDALRMAQVRFNATAAATHNRCRGISYYTGPAPEQQPTHTDGMEW